MWIIVLLPVHISFEFIKWDENLFLESTLAFDKNVRIESNLFSVEIVSKGI
jgi:hypothetical protein